MGKSWIKFVAILGLATLQACSGSKVAEDSELEGQEGAEVATTDEVPSPDGEQQIAEQLDETAIDSEAPAAEAPAPVLPVAEAPSPEVPASESKEPLEAATTASTTTWSASSESGETIDYTVRSGDTLMKIAFETYGDLYSWKKIYEMNKDRIPSVGALTAGTMLKLEKPSLPAQIQRNGEAFMIRSGDTLGTISGEVYGTDRKWRRLWDNNRQLVKDPNKIYAGFYLYYTFTEQDRMEKEQLKSAPAPIGKEVPQLPAQRTTSSLDVGAGDSVKN